MSVYWILLATLASQISADDAAYSPGLLLHLQGDDLETILTSQPPRYRLQPEASLHPGIPPNFRAEWSGELTVLASSLYRFEHEGAALWIDETPVEKHVKLESGHHSIRIVLDRSGALLSFDLQWSSDSFALEPLPFDALRHRRPPDSKFASAEHGRELYENLGCVHCHSAPGSSGLEGRAAPSLQQAGRRLRQSWMETWLPSPRARWSEALMPSLLDESEGRDVAAYLATRGGPLTTESSDPYTQSEVLSGEALFDSCGCRACHEENASPSARLPLSNLPTKTTFDALTEYLIDPLAIDASGRMPSIPLSDIEARQLAAYLLSRPASAPSSRPTSTGDPGRGRELVTTRGCLACHSISDDLPAWSSNAPSATKLRPNRGCLEEQPRGDNVPRYSLSTVERRDLVEFLVSLEAQPDRYPAPIHRAQRLIRQFRCTACHERSGGTSSGQLRERPPTLEGVGEKLELSWMRHVIATGARVRTRLRLRMPRFPASAARILSDGLAAEDLGLGDFARQVPVRPSVTESLSRRGLDLIGSDGASGGLSCVACHGYKTFEPIADERGPRLFGEVPRLRRRWFKRWLMDPGRIVSNTSMPNYFGQYSEVDANAAIDSLWEAIRLGEGLPRPVGTTARDFANHAESFPVPGTEAVVQRFILKGASPASIAVGLPRKEEAPAVSYCFDAATCQLEFAWHGGFLDLSRSHEKKMEYPALLGPVFFRAKRKRWLADRRDQHAVLKFRGYRLADGGYPTFLYDVEGMRVEERIEPLAAGIGYLATFDHGVPTRPTWISLPEGKNLHVRWLDGKHDERLDGKPDGRLDGKPDGPRQLRLPRASGQFRIEVLLLAKGEKGAGR